MKVALLAIGDEIVSGLTVDTNSGFLAELCRGAGAEPVGVFAAPDEPLAITRSLSRALEDAAVAISTGGLGPTADDLTSGCVAEFTGRPLELDEVSLAAIEERFRSLGREMTPNNRKQAMFPRGSTIIPNADGTAAGFITPASNTGAEGHIICLPGVPREMQEMARQTVVPWLESRNAGRRFASRVFSTFGLTESKLDQLLEGVVEPSEARLSFRAAFPRLQARVSVSGASDANLGEHLDRIEARVRERLGSALYATGDEGMEETVGRLLSERGLTLAVAESCTGGLIGHRLTDVPGSSDYFLLGAVVYSNAAKRNVLGVPADMLREHGAVSIETAAAMAVSVRTIAGASLGLATTGVAGPGGGTPEKPVGTVYIALASEAGVDARLYTLGNRGGARSREWVKMLTSQLALDRVRRHLLSDPG